MNALLRSVLAASVLLSAVALGQRREPTPGLHVATSPAPLATFSARKSSADIPADASGAVGRDHVVAALNAGITIQTREGVVLREETLNQFWSDVAGGYDYLYDPRVAYDPVTARWVLISIAEKAEEATAILLAVSETSDPVGTWIRHKIESDVLGDFLHLQFTPRSMLIVTNVSRETAGADVYVFDRTKFARTAATPPAYRRLHVPLGSFGAPAASDSSSDDDYLVVAGRSADTYQLRLVRLNANDVTTVKTFSIPASELPADPPSLAPQPGTINGLNVGLDVVANAVVRKGVVYAVQTAYTRGHSAVVLWMIRLGDLSSSTRIIEGEPTEYYGYPSVAVGSAGTLIGFNSFSKNHHPSGEYVHLPTAGARRPFRFAPGTSSVTGSIAWGDYSTTVVDPLDANRFWTLQSRAVSSSEYEVVWASMRMAVKRRAVR